MATFASAARMNLAALRPASSLGQGSRTPDSGGVLLGFQAGHNEEVQRENAYGSTTTMTWYRHNSDDVVPSMERAGFVVQSRVWRVAELAHETTRFRWVFDSP